MNRRFGASLAVVAVAVACASPDGGDPSARSGDKIGMVRQEAQQIMDKPAYEAARWTFYVEDPTSGLVLLSNQPDKMVFTGSTAKQFTVGTVYDTLGPDTRLTTPVYASAPTAGGVVYGDLVMVAAGDLALGGRGAMEGRVEHSFDSAGSGHIYGDVMPHSRKPPGDPLAGLDDLARQIAARGVQFVAGDVVVDTGLWEPSEGHEGLAPPIFVNDNILDIEVSPGAVGQPASLAITPQTAAFTVESRVDTLAGGEGAALEVAVDPTNERNIVVSGTIAAGDPEMVIYRIPDAGQWARTLFIEALARAGVTVAAPAVGSNDQSRVSVLDEYSEDLELASLQSPPLKEFGSMILETSYNTGANAMLCLLAARAASTDCSDGLDTVRDTIDKAGLRSDDIVLTDGEGAYPASATPRQMASWVKWADAQPWGAEFMAGQPILGETGSLAAFAGESPAKGKVRAKTGTVAVADPATGRTLFNVQSMSGYLTTDDDRRLVFNLSVSGATYPDVSTGIEQSGADVAAVAAAFQQQLSGR